MLNFVLEFEKVISKWPDNTPWTIAQLADYTNSSISVAVDAVSTSLNREFDIQETISLAEGKQILTTLRDRMSRQLEHRQRKIQADRDAAMRAYDLTMDSIRVSQQAKDFRTAYKTLSYFVGRYEKNIDVHLLVSLCGDCIRLGQKASANVQELGSWMRKAIETAAVSTHSDTIEDALDFLDTYGDLFKADSNGVGGKILNNALNVLQIPAMDCNLITEWNQLNNQLRPTQF
ncbi:MAG: hypothetical protein NT027_20425 [Proteobacteria bacterium]|nr:hypothetical protein [Pseudomonadota bacterium]